MTIEIICDKCGDKRIIEKHNYDRLKYKNLCHRCAIKSAWQNDRYDKICQPKKKNIPSWVQSVIDEDIDTLRYNSSVTITCPVCGTKRNSNLKNIRRSKNKGVCVKCALSKKPTKQISGWNNKEWLEEHYINKEMTFQQIADLVGASKRYVRLRAANFGIKSRSNSASHKKYDYDIDNIIKLYMDGHNINTIANMHNMSRENARKILIKHGGCRTYKEAAIIRLANKPTNIPFDVWYNKEWIRNKYEEGNSIKDISNIVGISRTCILDTMYKFGIETRTTSEAIELKINHIKELWKDPEFRRRMALSKSKVNKISSLQRTFYKYLDYMGVSYVAEYPIGPYTFDCFIKPNILVDIQGEYIHSLPGRAALDKSKATYVEKQLKDYRLLIYDEIDFYFVDKLLQKIANDLDIDGCDEEFEFDDCIIENASTEDVRLFLSCFHYLGGVGGNGPKYALTLNKSIIAICCFSPLIRKEIATSMSYATRDCWMLSRFCISPFHHKKNLATWFISKCIKRFSKLKPHIKYLFSFSDPTFGHDGTIYKACGWQHVGKTSKSYYYIDDGLNIIHKKTLYSHAKRVGRKEREYAMMSGYIKVWGLAKDKWMYKLGKL